MNVFEKVSFQQYLADWRACFKYDFGDDEYFSDREVREVYDGIKIPQRSTRDSAGYDFYCPYEIAAVGPKPSIILTGIRAKLDSGNVLLLFPRSSLATKHGLVLANSVGVVDADYYNAKNEGHIQLRMRCERQEGYVIKEDERVAQGIIFPYVVADNGNTDNARVGGFGSTGA